MKHKIISSVLVLTMSLSCLAGCGNAETNDVTKSDAEAENEAAEEEPEPTEEETEDEPITLTMWTVFTGSDGDILREIIDNYNETNTDNIKVEIDIMPNDTLQSKLPTAISTGTGPSFVLMGIEYLNEYVANDCLEDISDFWTVTGTNKDNYYENVLAKSYIDGSLYGVPMQYNLQYLYYNKDLFEQAGLDPEAPPTTFEELEACAKALTDPMAGIYGLSLAADYGYYVQYLWGNGGEVINTSTDENLLYSEENIKTLEWLQDLAEAGVSPAGVTSAEADTMFQAGQLAMCMAGPWNINALNSLGINYGITAIPGGSDGAYSAEGGCSYMLPVGSDEATKEAVYKFMAYWLTDDILKEWSNRNGFPVWSYSLLEDAEIKENEILSNVSKASSIGRDWHLGYAFGSQIDNDVMAPMIEKILSGSDVTATVEEASATLDGILQSE